MNVNITPITQISPQNTWIAIKVRIINMWRQNEYALNTKSLEMILMDKEVCLLILIFMIYINFHKTIIYTNFNYILFIHAGR